MVVEALSTDFVKQFWQFINDGKYKQREKSNDDYYNYMIEHSKVEDGLHHANIEALICLKAKAFLEIKDRIEKGSKGDSKQLRKHKADVFRLTVMLTPESEFELPETIQSHLNQFAELTSGDLPDKAIFKEMGLDNIDPHKVFEQFIKSFKIKPVNE